MRNANQFKGLAKGISRSVYPGSYTNHKEWTDSHTEKRFNDTMYRIRFLTLNNKEDDKRSDCRNVSSAN